MLAIIKFTIALVIFVLFMFFSEGSEVEDLARKEDYFYDVDAYGDDFVDFGAQIGPDGSFAWHSDHPVVN
ncbi:unnamed protein product [Hermetia illucens]|uniref:Uncharacterized protein n=1 Tax=Hermetia illucens TaxID=343691 RepID=A0A7R8UFR1_HERIL|nr:unnamed protein product [Hermetia illucens]